MNDKISVQLKHLSNLRDSLSAKLTEFEEQSKTIQSDIWQKEIEVEVLEDALANVKDSKKLTEEIDKLKNEIEAAKNKLTEFHSKSFQTDKKLIEIYDSKIRLLQSRNDNE